MDQIMQLPEQIWVSTDSSQFNFDFICSEIQNSYWGLGRPRETIIKSIENSLCFAIFKDREQVGLARVITDYVTFAYLCDVLITESWRGRGLGKKLLHSVFTNPTLQSVKWFLRTRDAHGLYEKFGFSKTHRPHRYMEKL